LDEKLCADIPQGQEALLMVSRLPVFSGKRVGTLVPPEMVGLLIVLIVLSFALLIAYPWIMLSAGALAL
jgi:CDP-diacylglycerol--serine O-phosphatidyltransferase